MDWIRETFRMYEVVAVSAMVLGAIPIVFAGGLRIAGYLACFICGGLFLVFARVLFNGF